MTPDPLSPREREIMDALLIRGEGTAREIQDALKAPLANATIRTMLRILESKGAVKHRMDGRRFVYRPTRPRHQQARTAMNRLVKVFYEGSITQTVSSLLQMGDKKLSDAELEELSAMVDAAKRNRRKNS
ncbi:MAG: BlaI family penicillinase repressor [Verrucomicrobiales bacterium]|jgi:BlaI family penicillinase repressor